MRIEPRNIVWNIFIGNFLLNIFSKNSKHIQKDLKHAIGHTLTALLKHFVMQDLWVEKKTTLSEIGVIMLKKYKLISL